jgi:serine/threonine-protein kinase
MADIFEALDKTTGDRVALKVLREELTNDADTLVRFRREAQAAGAVRHPNVARVFECGATEKNRPFIVMELLEGRDLAHELDARGVLPLADAVRIITEACRGMIAAHEAGIVHRDLKPSNLFLAQDGGRTVTKVLDFGISKYVAQVDENVTLTKALFGSPLYMSPEQFRSAKAADHRSDIWSLGVIFYEMLTGLPPFVAENAPSVGLAVTREPHVPPTQRRRSLPKPVDLVIDGALKKDPRERYPSMAALLDAIGGILPRQREDTPTQLQAVPSASVPPKASAPPPAFSRNLTEPSSYPPRALPASAPPAPSAPVDDPTTQVDPFVGVRPASPAPSDLDLTRDLAAPLAAAFHSSRPPSDARSDPRSFALPIPSEPPPGHRSTEPTASTVPPRAPPQRPWALALVMLLIGAAGATAFFLLRSPASAGGAAQVPAQAPASPPEQSATPVEPVPTPSAEPEPSAESASSAESALPAESSSAEEPSEPPPKKGSPKKRRSPPAGGSKSNDKGLFMPKGI